MKAVLVKEFDRADQVVVEEVPPRQAGPGEVLIAVKACGVNFLDALMVRGKYQTLPPRPFTPGAEVSGTVKAVGAGVAGVSVGTRVLAVSGYGGWAEEVAVPISRVYVMPAQMDFPTAAAFPIVYATAHHALKDRAHLAAGETLLVLGAAGGAGLAAVEIGSLIGARVIACASSEQKLALCREYGAAALVDYSASDWRERVRELTGGKGVDVVFDPVGGTWAEPALRSLGFQGRYLVIGFASGEIPKIPLNLVLLKVTSIVGVFWGAHTQAEPEHAAATMAALLDWYAQGRLRPHICATYPLAAHRAALDMVRSRTAAGKVVIVID
jgi:NADPH:quinone reductase